MSALEDILKSQIAASGPMDIAAFMALALGHPEHGYYMTRDPFGADGDFVTAPEVSQMFGEMIGAWAANCWMKLGAPSRFVLLECGPGRGTLMADALRATKGVSGFHDALEVCLVEMSPVLRAAQEAALVGYDVRWHESLEGVAQDAPIIVIANEFFDALPARQLLYQGGAWHERVIGMDNDGALVFGLKGCPLALWPQFGKPGEGDVFEFSPARENFMAALAERVRKQSGAALIIDYGHERSFFGDTLQGVSKHNYSDIFNNIGGIDLTSHVDFEALKGVSEEQGVQIEGVSTQRVFLQALGIEMRSAALEKVSEVQGQIAQDLERLIGVNQMGELFKVMVVHYDAGGEVAEF